MPDPRMLLLLLFAQMVAALDAPLVEMTAQPTQAAIGDHISVTVTYRWPTGWHTSEPNPTEAFGEAFVVECPPPERARTAEEERRTWRLVLLATRSGPWVLPRPVLHATGPQGTSEVTAPEVAVQIGAEATAPRPAAARPLWTAGSGEVEPKRWLAATIAAACAIAALVAWWLLGRRIIIRSEPPGERLRRELTELAGLRDGKEISARLGLALRRWCGAVFTYDGPGLTTRETLARLRGTLKDDEHSTLGRLLGDLDDLRWAAGALDAGTVLPLTERALAWSDGVSARIEAERVATEKAKAA